MLFVKWQPEKIIKVTRVSDVTTLEEARPAITPSSPNIRRNTALAFPSRWSSDGCCSRIA